jgi:hypothetical protein
MLPVPVREICRWTRQRLSPCDELCRRVLSGRRVEEGLHRACAALSTYATGCGSDLYHLASRVQRLVGGGQKLYDPQASSAVIDRRLVTQDAVDKVA